MKKLWLLLFLAFAFPALADTEQEAGQSAKATRVSGIKFPSSDTTVGGSIAIGNGALSRQYIPAAYGNVAIGNGAMSGKMTAAATGNVALGGNSCKGLTSGSNNICVGQDNVASNITSGTGNIYFGSFIGSNVMGASSNNIVFDPEDDSAQGATTNGNVILGTHDGSFSGSYSIFIGGDCGYNNVGTGSLYNFCIGLNAGRNNMGYYTTENNIILFGGSGNSPQYLTDTATSATNNTIVFGNGYGGTNDTIMGYLAMQANRVNTGQQTAMGYKVLNASNVANSHNTAFGYQSGLLISTGTNNLTLGYNVGSTVLTTGSNNILIGTSASVTTPASGTSSMLDIGNLIYGNLAGTAVPVITSCGTSPSVDTHANDASGTVTAGSGTVASCTITFSSAYNTWNHCQVTSQAGNVAGFAYSYTKSAITITGTSITSDKFDYKCDGY